MSYTIMLKPNIFQIAKKELSQDAFFTWLIQWSDRTNRQFDEFLHITAQNFTRLLINESNDFSIYKVEAERQWENIDISVKVNEDIFIVIEDKTNTEEHADQLERYKKTSEKFYKNKRNRLFFIYLKTGNESLSSLSKVEEKGYRIIDRKAILAVLSECKSDNQILIEFRDNLNNIDKKSTSFNLFKNIVSDWYAAQGFFIKLQELLAPQWSDWRYVANQTGGFLGFWYHWINTGKYSLYIQIENAFDYGIKLVIKMGDWDPTVDTLYKVLEELQPIASENGLKITKPDRYRAGETSTLAIVSNAFQKRDDMFMDLDKFLSTMKILEKILNIHKDSKTILQ